MKKLIYCLLFLLLFREGVTQQSTNIDKEIEQIVITTFRLDSIKKPVVDSLRRVAEGIGDARLLAYNDFLNKEWQWAYGTKSPEEKDRLEAEIVHIGENSPFIDLRGHALFWKGTNLFYERKNDTKALSWFLTGKKLLEEAHYERFPYIMDYYKGMMDIYSHFGDFKKAIYYCEQAIKLPESNLYGRHSLYNDLGTYYVWLRKFDKAETAFQAGIAVCKQHNWTNFETMIRGNLGNMLRLRGDYKGALPYYYESLQKNEKEFPESVALDRIYLARCLLQLDSISKAKQYLTFPNFAMPTWSESAYKHEQFETLALYYEKVGNFALAARFKDSLLVIKEGLRMSQDNRKLIVLESSLEAERYMSERKALESERHWRDVVIICLVLVFSGILYWFFQKRRHEKALEQEKRHRAEEKLAAANQQLTQYLANIKQKNDLIERISQQFDGQIDLKLTDTEKNQHLQTIQNSVLLTETDWTEFKILFEPVFPNFFVQLIKDYPELTQAEIRLVALEKLNLHDKEKGTMLGISADSVKKSRYRLRKKYPALLQDK